MLIHQKENSTNPDRAYNQAIELFKTGLKLKPSCHFFSPFFVTKGQKIFAKITKASLFNQFGGGENSTFIIFYLLIYMQALAKELVPVPFLGNCRATGMCEQLFI